MINNNFWVLLVCKKKTEVSIYGNDKNVMLYGNDKNVKLYGNDKNANNNGKLKFHESK